MKVTVSMVRVWEMMTVTVGVLEKMNVTVGFEKI